MTRQRIQKQKTVQRRERGDDGDGGTDDRARGERASTRAQGVTEAARRFLARVPRP
ncbi:hypothetical protein ACIP79_00810 [Streptomyces sp. NPDC088747]|uniref:hypothetical protein n=1 Tax=Streptomyces sp. NPDC088747 TaxID=3365886 RepID=UPI0038131C94